MSVPYAVPAMVAGPGIAGLLLTGVVYGRSGFHELRIRLLTWRVGARWSAIALLTAQVLIMAVLLALSLISLSFLPRILTTSGTASLLLMGLAVGLWEPAGGDPHALKPRGITIILFPPLAVVANLISGFACAAAMWVVLAAVAVAQGWHLTPQPLRKRPAYEND